MAVGSNTLGLLFKIGVDPGDAQKALQQLVANSADVRAGMASEMRKMADELDGGLKKVGSSFSETLTKANQLRRGVEETFSGDVIEGTINLTRSLGPLAVAFGAVAVAAAAVGFAIKGAIDAAREIGTESKDDFEELQKKVQSAGLEITQLQRDLSQGIMGALDQISGATTALFAKLIEKAGPALIELLGEVTKVIKALIPYAESFGSVLTDGIIQAIAAWRTLKDEIQHPPVPPPSLGRQIAEAFFPPLVLGDLAKLQEAENKSYAENLKKVREEVEKLTVSHAKFKDEGTKALKDITAAQLEYSLAVLQTKSAQEQAAVATAEINRLQEKGMITFEEGARRRIAVQKVVDDLERAALDAREKAAARLPERKQAEELAKIAAERESLRLKEAAQQENENNRIIDQDKKLHDALTAHFEKERQQRLDYIKFLQKSTDDIIIILARQGREIPGGPTGVLGLPSPEEVDAALKKIHDKIIGFRDQLEHALKSSGGVIGDWHKLFAGTLDDINNKILHLIETGKVLQALGSFIKDALPLDTLIAMNDALSQLTQTFIQTGKTGPAVMKQFAAAVLKELATIAQQFAAASFAAAIWFLIWQDYKDAALAFASGVAWEAVALAIGYAASKVGPSKATAAAGGAGGFGGEAAAPGTVTINQGADASSLAIQAQTLSVLSDMNNKLTTASPGDVLAKGAEQNPLVVGQANNEAARRDGTVSRQFLEIAGLRPA